MPWELPDEFKHFTATTIGAAVIMGRKTYEDHRCELPGRLNIVVTSQKDYPLVSGVHRANSLPHALDLAQRDREQVFVIGGADCLRDALPLAETVYETVVHAEIEGDTFIESFDFEGWSSDLLETHSVDDQHLYAFSAYRYHRPVQPVE